MGFWKSLGIIHALNAKTPGDLAAGLYLVAREEEKERERKIKKATERKIKMERKMEREREKKEKQLSDSEIEASAQRVLNDFRQLDFEKTKRKMIDDLNEFIKSDSQNLNQAQIDRLYGYLKEANNCNQLTVKALLGDVIKYFESLAPFIYIHTAMAELKEKVNAIDDSKLSKDVKLQINKMVSVINNSVELDELKYNLHELEVYMTEEQHISMNFDYVYSELEKSIEMYKD